MTNYLDSNVFNSFIFFNFLYFFLFFDFHQASSSDVLLKRGKA